MDTNPQIELARRYISNTGMSIFLTGKAGTGKTTFLHDINLTCYKRHVVVAPTGVAAVNAGGVTIHSFFQLPFEPYLPEVKELVTEYQMPENTFTLNKTKVNIIRTLELLIIDEISMVRADLLDAVDMMLKRYRRSSRPFGGVQLLMIGDVHQLPPVVTDAERPYLERVYKSPFFFCSKALQKMQYVTIELTKIFRQQDAIFVDLLNKVRENKIDDHVLEVLNRRVDVRKNTNESNPPITLTTHNYQSDRINRQHMDALKGKSLIMKAIISGNFPDSAMPIDNELLLKVKERVMFVKNDSSGGKRYFNGKLGTITAFNTDDEGNTLIEVIDDDGEIINVGREVWENIKYTVSKSDNTIQQLVDGYFCQYPLKAAWAVTIHKAQGLTFDKVRIDAVEAFAFGQVYVALSRCRTLEGLSLVSSLRTGVTFSDADVTDFIDSKPTLEQVRLAIPHYEQQYYYEQVGELFGIGSLMKNCEELEHVYYKLRKIFPKNSQAATTLTHEAIELDNVSNRFMNQLARLPIEQHTERIAKATDYYLEKLSAMLNIVKALTGVDVDNKEAKLQLKEVGDTMTDRIGEKVACLEAVKKSGFKVETVLKAKVDHQLGKKEDKKEKKKTINLDLDNLQNVELIETISAWRKVKSKEEGNRAFMIINQKALYAIAQELPRTEKELLNIPGLGKAKVSKYGSDILEMVDDYVREKELETQ